MTGYIYIITNKVNGKNYIGQTRTRVERRWHDHFKPSAQRKSCLARAIYKHGKANFKKEVLEIICADSKQELSDKLNEREIYFIAKYESNVMSKGYNLTSGGNQCFLSEITKQKIALTKIGSKNPNYGKKTTEQAKERRKITMEIRGGFKHTADSKIKASLSKKGVNNPNYGKVYTAYEKLQMSEKSKARNFKHTAESKLKMITTRENNKTSQTIINYSNSKLGIKNPMYGKSGLLSPVAKAVSQFDRLGNFIAEYETATTAARITGISQKNISSCCTGGLKSAGGYIWKHSNKL